MNPTDTKELVRNWYDSVAVGGAGCCGAGATPQEASCNMGYSEAELVGRLVACVVNMPPRNIAGFQSEVLILGAKNARSDVILLSPLADIALGEPVF